MQIFPVNPTFKAKADYNFEKSVKVLNGVDAKFIIRAVSPDVPNNYELNAYVTDGARLLDTRFSRVVGNNTARYTAKVMQDKLKLEDMLARYNISEGKEIMKAISDFFAKVAK